MKDRILSTNPGIYQGLADFRYTLRRFLSFSEAVTHDAGMTPQQYQVLLVVQTFRPEGVTMTELAEQLLLKPHSAVELINRMSASGLVERSPSPTDGRSVLITMSDNGLAALEKLAAAHAGELMIHERALTDALRRLKKLRGADHVRLVTENSETSD